VLAWRAWYRETVAAVAAGAGRPDPEYVAQALLMLRDGAASAGYLEDGPTARDRVRRAAAAVIA
jgi:hypothetical protein